MRGREIPVELVEAAVREPDWEEPAAAALTNRWKRVADRFLRVTVREEIDRIVVVTAVFRRKPPVRRDEA